MALLAAIIVRDSPWIDVLIYIYGSMDPAVIDSPNYTFQRIPRSAHIRKLRIVY